MELERDSEHAEKLQGLAREFSEKKTKMGGIIRHWKPTKQEMGPGYGLQSKVSCRSAMRNQRIFIIRLNVVYYDSDQIITSIVDSTQSHIRLVDELNSRVVKVLKEVE